MPDSMVVVNQDTRARPEIERVPASAAEAILKAGTMCFIATHWLVSGSGAGVFARQFYDRPLAGMKSAAPVCMSEAVLAARRGVKGAAKTTGPTIGSTATPTSCLNSLDCGMTFPAV